MWLARIRSEDKTAADERAFHEWLARSPAHIAAFEAVTDIWETMGAVRRHPVRRRWAPARVSRRGLVLAGTATAAVAATVLVFNNRAQAATYETGVGEQRRAALPDGTQVLLDTFTRLRANFGDRTRIVDLERGRCNFDVMEYDKRPFVINAADKCIVAGHTTLDVLRDGDDVTVTVVRGSAAVSGGPLAAEKPCVLSAGDRVIVGRSSAQTDKPDLTHVLAWQSGQVVFENTTLAEAVHELNQYSMIKLETDAAAAPLQISGVFRVGDNVAFARLVVALLPVAVSVDVNRIRFSKKTTSAG